MHRMPDSVVRVFGGVDTHRDSHVAAALDEVGKLLGTAAFSTTPAGYRDLLGWLESFGVVVRVGVEGTGSWGAGLARFLQGAGVAVAEVIRPNRQTRRRYGKSDATDAVAAARAVLSGQASGEPRGGEGPVESIRFLRIARRSARKQLTAVINQIHAVVATSPDEVRRSLRDASIPTIVTRAARYRPGDPTDPIQGAKVALKALAVRYRHLSDELDHLDTVLEGLVQVAAPAELMAMCGVGPHTAADLLLAAGSNPQRLTTEQSFAGLCGVSPVDASSGRQQRHRLNRGGDRQANAALYRIVIVRLRYHQATRDYMTRRLAQGRTKPEIIRCLKRYLARDIWKTLTTQPTPATP